MLHMRAAQDLAKSDTVHDFWLAKQCSASAMYAFELCEKELANQNAAIIQPNNALEHKRNSL